MSEKSELPYSVHPENLRFQPVEPMTEANAAAFLARQATIDTSAGQCWMMCAVERRTDGRMVGEVGVYLSPAIERTGNIGWAIHPDYQGQGLASEAARALLDHLFVERNLHRVTATGNPRNVASTRVMERLGMRREGSMLKSV
jgi:RimJ/RimL family protein N-acetyltransferase